MISVYLLLDLRNPYPELALLERGETTDLAPFLVPQEKSVSINGFNLSVW